MQGVQQRLFEGVALLCLTLATAECKAVGENPFDPGTMKYGEYMFKPAHDGCPMYSTMYFPLVAGNYTPIFFLGGFYDFVTTDFYSDFLQNLTMHGYIVVGIDYYHVPWLHIENKKTISTASKVSEYYVEIKKQMDWLRANITTVTYATPDWSRLTFLCHSASCDTTLRFVRDFDSYAAASIYLDPVSLGAPEMQPVKRNTVTLAYTTKKSFNFPQCCIHGMGYKRIYDLMTSLKMRIEVENFGHCDILNKGEWKLCANIICKAGAKDKLPDYHEFTLGIIHAFLQFSLYNDQSMNKYLTDTSNMPLAVSDLANNFNSTFIF